MLKDNTGKNQICEYDKSVEAIYILDKAGSILASYNQRKVDERLLEEVKNIYERKMRRRTLNSYQLNCHKIWYIKEDGIIFSMLTTSSLPEKVSKHILKLIKKPFLQGFKENLETYYKQRKIIQSYEEILKGCCYPLFIEILVKELEEKKQ
ncbi:MAG: hypothetical protein OdinLCB4_007680 [Candidatus Odinarchaeum yellowstonii]|uniref:Longin domain-containing protein n=1 Tax=Odinarchaeota yellowstonii (strain LCB_4) TaxID=1841599 RepID=A0AAF0D2A4_ODILC|nr:MAG: hypothetical protein OdinLCB4_007680 [Candidatus Odinarchaeum yellowstonii]